MLNRSALLPDDSTDVSCRRSANRAWIPSIPLSRTRHAVQRDVRRQGADAGRRHVPSTTTFSTRAEGDSSVTAADHPDRGCVATDPDATDHDAVGPDRQCLAQRARLDGSPGRVAADVQLRCRLVEEERAGAQLRQRRDLGLGDAVDPHLVGMGGHGERRVDELPVRRRARPGPLACTSGCGRTGSSSRPCASLWRCGPSRRRPCCRPARPPHLARSGSSPAWSASASRDSDRRAARRSRPLGASATARADGAHGRRRRAGVGVVAAR